MGLRKSASVRAGWQKSRGWLEISYQICIEVVSTSSETLSCVEVFGDRGPLSLPSLSVVVLTGSANTASLDLDKDIIVTQFWKRNLDDGELGGL